VHTSIVELLPNLAVVVVEWLEVLVDVGDGAGEAQVERPENTDIPRAETRRIAAICQLDACKKQLEPVTEIGDYARGNYL
jgi:hypothetical protein